MCRPHSHLRTWLLFLVGRVSLPYAILVYIICFFLKKKGQSTFWKKINSTGIKMDNIRDLIYRLLKKLNEFLLAKLNLMVEASWWSKRFELFGRLCILWKYFALCFNVCLSGQISSKDFWGQRSLRMTGEQNFCFQWGSLDDVPLVSHNMAKIT